MLAKLKNALAFCRWTKTKRIYASSTILLLALRRHMLSEIRIWPFSFETYSVCNAKYDVMYKERIMFIGEGCNQTT